MKLEEDIHMKKWVVLMGLMLAAMIVVSACGKSDSGSNGGNAGSGTGEVKEFTIDATNFDFDLKEIKVNKGDTVKLKLVNSQGNHALMVEGYKKEVKGNQTITFVADKTGEFNYICSIFCGNGHDDMLGKLIVQ